jgi:hypothetical protein
MTVTEKQQLEDYVENRKQTRWQQATEWISDNLKYIAGFAIIVAVLGQQGIIDVPKLGVEGWFYVSSAILGGTVGVYAVMYVIEDYLRDRRVQVALTPIDSPYLDVIKIPRRTFAEFTVIGSRFPDRNTIGGSKVLAARCIDFKNKVIIPAGEFPAEEQYPDDLSLIAEDADPSKVEQYREALIEDARERRKITVDKEVIRESAMSDSVDLFADALREVRDANIELEQMSDAEVEAKAEDIVRTMAQQQPEDGGDDGE